MGVKTVISLDEVNILFANFTFTSLVPTSSGVMDTTYIVSDDSHSYILKKYERDIAQKIESDKKLLSTLKLAKLNVPTCVCESGGWFLYEKLKGSQPTIIKSYHIVALGRFLSKLHKHTYKKTCTFEFMQSYEMAELLDYAKTNFYSYYKKLQFLESFEMQNDGFIHGDIFKDNTVFEGQKIGVFDFIDSGCGSFSFDCAVALVGFEKVSKLYINLFLRAYNQHAVKKLSKKELLSQIKKASRFYALLRINHHKNSKNVKELMIF